MPTIDFANLSQTSKCTFSVTGSDGNPVPDSGYQAVAAIGDPTVVNVHQQVPGVNSFVITPLKTASSTTITWTLSPTGAYSGSPLVLPADTVNVDALSLASATDAYTPPA